MQSKIRRISLAGSVVTGALAVSGLISPLQAEDKLLLPPQSEQAEKVELFSGKIEELNLETKTVLVAKQTYLVVETTKLMDKDKPIKLADLKVGIEIHGLAKKNAAGKLEATIIKVGPKPKDPAPEPRQQKE